MVPLPSLAFERRGRTLGPVRRREDERTRTNGSRLLTLHGKQPILPLSLKGYKDVACHICNFRQPLDNRPDVTAMAQGQPPPPVQHGHGAPA